MEEPRNKGKKARSLTMQGANTYVSLLLLGSHSHPLLSMSKLQSLSGSISPGNNPPVFWPGGLTDFQQSELNTIINKGKKKTNFANLVEKAKQQTNKKQPCFNLHLLIYKWGWKFFQSFICISDFFYLFPLYCFPIGVFILFPPFKAKSSLYMLEMWFCIK